MSGPFPPPGYPQQPTPGNWPGNYQQPGQPAGTSGYGQQQPAYDFPTVQYSGLGGGTGNGNWGQPPRKPRRVGRILVAVISVLVIVGGVTTAILVLNQRNQQTSASGAKPTSTSAAITTTESATSSAPSTVDGTTTLTLTVGQCANAVVSGSEYAVNQKTTCGAANSDLVLAKTAATLADCANHEYLLIQGQSGIDCFTLDVRPGDCLDNNYLKVPCTSAPFVVISIETGPGGSTSCADASGATHWVPIGANPVKVGCIGPPKS